MIALLLLACHGAAPTPSAGAIVFPHAAGYEAGALHGPEVVRAGATVCLGCHREDADAGSCASCHAGYPHPEGWLAGAVHGVGLSGDAGARVACEACHGVEGLSATACTSCHGSWPHPEGWVQAGQHGAWALARGSADASCGACHASGESAPTCTSCHANYPHPAGWAEAAAHGTADPASCAACHGSGGEGGVSGVACSRCHPSYPHAEDWGRGHLAVVEQTGAVACQSCHEAASALPARCGVACHGATP